MRDLELIKNIFKRGFETYKNHKKTNKNIVNHMVKNQAEDYVVFKKINTSFKIIQDMLLFCVLSKYGEHFDAEDVLNSEVNIPSNMEDVYSLYISFADAIELIKEDLFNIINIENYEGMLLINKINPLLYYTTIDNEQSERIIELSNNADELFLNASFLIKKMLKIYLLLCKDEH